MSRTVTRRSMIRTLAASGAALSSPWAWPALAQGEDVVPFADVTAAAAGGRVPPPLTEFFTPNDAFFTVAHYPLPEVDAATWRLRITGLVNRPLSLSLAELQQRPRVEQVVGFECAGNNNARGNPLVGNARWVGTRLAPLLEEAGLLDTAREVVFYGADRGLEDVSHGGATERVEQHFGRSLTLADALRPDVMIAWQMNGEPLPRVHGAPMRLIDPGSYGVGNVKWLDRVHVQDTRYAGRFMTRDYVTLQGRRIDDQLIWEESWVSRIRVKSAIGRVTRAGSTCTILGFALTDGTPLRGVDVKIDDGPWQPATLDARNSAYSWQLFSFTWRGATPGEHTLVSRATDALGRVQPSTEDLALKKTRWENNDMFVRRIVLNP